MVPLWMTILEFEKAGYAVQFPVSRHPFFLIAIPRLQPAPRSMEAAPAPTVVPIILGQIHLP